MSVYKTKSGRWYYNFMINGQRYHRAIKGCTEHKKAVQIENKIKTAVCEGNYELVDLDNTPTLEDAVEIYLAYSEQYKRSYQNDVNNTKIIMEYWGKNCKLKTITPASIDGFIDSVREVEVERTKYEKDPETGKKIKIKYKAVKTRANGTINRYLQALKKMFNMAISEGWVKTNPMKGKPLLKEDNYKNRILEKTEQKKLLQYLKGTYMYDVVLTALHTGLRRENIRLLEWSNINFDEDYIELIVFKNNKRLRIPLSPVLKKRLSEVERTSNYVFVNPDTGLPYNDFKGMFERAVKNAGIEGFTFHCLRHTAATRMIKNGVDIVTVKEILNHSSVKTTMRYTHSNDDAKKKAIQALSRY